MTVTIDILDAAQAIVIVVFAAVLAGIVALAFRRVRSFFRSRGFEAADRQGMRKRWSEIETMAGASGEMNRKLAIIEADKLLDHALKSLAMPGETLGERLKFAAYKYPRLNDVWWAHKVRNQLAHEATFHLDSAVAKKAIAAFRRALELLGAI